MAKTLTTRPMTNGHAPGGIGNFDIPDSPITKHNDSGSSNPFKKAKKGSTRLKMALTGPPGAGKTMTALKITKELGGRTACIDTEHGSALRYADEFDFDHIELDDFSPDAYVQLIEAAQAAGYTNIIIDSMSHAWNGKNGLLEQVEYHTKQSRSQNSFQAWGAVKPMESGFWETILSSNCNIIACFRTKQAYEVQVNEKGKNVPVKIGMAPIQREGIEYEFDIVGDMNVENEIMFTKSRCSSIKNKLFKFPGKNIMDIIIPWLGTPEAAEAKEQAVREHQISTGVENSTVEEEQPVATEYTVTNGYPDNELDTIGKILKGETVLRDEKVKGWIKPAEVKKSRSEFFEVDSSGGFTIAALGQLHKYLHHLMNTFESLP